MDTLYYKGILSAGSTILVDDENEFRHAVKSLRKKNGDTITVTNGEGALYLAEVTALDKRSISLLLQTKIDRDADYTQTNVFVALALLNQSSKMKLAVEKLTEMGISGFLPFQAERTVFPDKNLKGLEASAVSALKQCGGSQLPEIFPILTMPELLELKSFDHKYFCHITTNRLPDNELSGRILVAVGPEGGWTEAEIEQFVQHGFQPLALNKRVLRAETAALVAAARFLK